MKPLKDIFSIFFPDVCVNCQSILLRNEQFLCTICLNDLPVIVYNESTKNMLQNIFFGKVPVENVYSFLYFTKFGITQKLIHELKYKKEQNIGVFLGRRMCYEIERLKLFKEIDIVLPVPLHKKKLKLRGYNQVSKFGGVLSNYLQVPYIINVLKRVSKNESQTLKRRFERFSNADSKFHISDLEYLQNKHVLLIDDVITTGATLVSCCEELLKVKNIKISICTIAYTEIG
ncbi:comF family protein [Tenacibaculum sp. MAR_2009_124]|nr:comF family protein [Tenacibaculum sp. MAR_2009_124]